jgi:hypothetical protein
LVSGHTTTGLVSQIKTTYHYGLCHVAPSCWHVQVGARSVLLEGSMMEDYSVLQPGSVLPPTRRVPTGAHQQLRCWPLHGLYQSSN